MAPPAQDRGPSTGTRSGRSLIGLTAALWLSACVPGGQRPPAARPSAAAVPARPAAPPVALVGGNVWTADGKGTVFAQGTVILRDGKIAAVGDASTPVPAGVRTIDVSGRWVTPGLIDAHS